MNKEEIIAFLEEQLHKTKQELPGAFNTIAAYEYVINDLLNED